MSPSRLGVVLIFFFASTLGLAQEVPRKPAYTATTKAPVAAVSAAPLGAVPIHFEENVGQTDSSVRFIARGAGYTIFLTPQEAVFLLSTIEKTPRNPHDRHKPRLFKPSAQALAVRMKLLGANASPEISGTGKLPGVSNYFFGKNKDRWHTHVANYASAAYSGVYPGIDMLYYGNQRQLEYDFVVQAGADPSAIKFAFSGVNETSLSPTGDLQMKNGLRTLVLHSPSIYQLENGIRKPISGRYSLNPDHSIGVSVPNFDHSKQLVIDPVLQYSTYVGGSGDDFAYTLALDPQGNSYIVGATTSPDFPATGTIGDPVVSSNTVPFITKLDPTGTTLLYSDYFGGSGQDSANGMAVDANGYAYVIGSTNSADFPITSSAFQSTLASGATNAFLAKFSADGSSLAYSTYLGGAADDEAMSVAVDSAQNAYLTGFATSSGSNSYPTTTSTAFQSSLNGAIGNAFFTRIDTTQSGANSLIYSTYLGGANAQPFGDVGYGIALDSSSRAYLTGETTSTDFPTTTTLPQSSVNPNGTVFASLIDTTKSGAASLIYSTFLAGTGALGEGGYAAAVDQNQKMYLIGFTSSADFPATTSVASCPTNPSSLGTVFVAKLDPTLSGQSTLIYSTCAGGSGGSNAGDLATSIAVDPNGAAYYAGSTDSADFPVTSDALQSTSNSAVGSGFLSILNSSGSSLLYSTYLGGSAPSYAWTVALDSTFNIYVDGNTASTGLPGTSGEFQPALAGDSNAFVSKFSGLNLPFITSLSNDAGSPGAQIAISGGNFGSSQGSSTITFGGTAATAVSWNSSAIIALVPASLAAGPAPIVVTTSAGSTAPVAFSVAALTLSSVSPSSAPIGAVVSLVGSGFGTQPAVTFNGTPALPIGGSDTFISVSVPAGATTGNVAVQTSGAVSNPLPFAVIASQFPPSISASLSPTPNASDWNNTNVTISYTCSAGGNLNNGGVPLTNNSCPPAQVVAAEGANQQISATVTDAGANTASITTTLNIDKTPPAVTVTSPVDGAGFNTSAVTISGSASDSLSGLASVACNGTSVTVTSGSFSCNISLNPGVNLAMVQATDNAGNVGAALLHLTFVTALPAPSSLQITPANANVLVGSIQQFTAIDQLGRPRSDAIWSIDNTNIATISTDTSPILTGVAAGTATLTAAIGSISAQVQVHVLAGTALPVGAVVWSAPSVPGFTTQQIVQAVPTLNGPSLYAIDSDGSANFLIRAFTSDGQQLWQSLLPMPQVGFSLAPAMGDASGGLLLISGQAISDIDGPSGAVAWQNTSAAANPSNSSQAAVGQDGSISAPDGNGNLLRIDPASGNGTVAYTSPPSVSSGMSGLCMGPLTGVVFTGAQSSISYASPSAPVIDASGNAFFITSATTSSGQSICVDNGVDTGASGTYSTAYYAVKLAPDGSATSTALPIASGDGTPAVLAPDGNGGALVQWITSNSGVRVMDSSGGAYSSPLPNGSIVQLVLDGQGNALATDSQTVVSFGMASGQTNWSYTPGDQGTVSIIAATSDGGVRLNDSAGGLVQLSETGQPTTITSAPIQGFAPFYSWQGHWYTQVAVPNDPLAEISGPAIVVSNVWPYPLGNPSSSGRSNRQWFFALVWENNFSFTPSNPQVLSNLTTDVTGSASMIKESALKAFRAAYSIFPVTVFEGSANAAADAYALVMNHQNLSNSYDGGDTPPRPNRGISPPTAFTNQMSQIDYINIMLEAQTALGIVINNAQDETTALNQQALMQAIGTGIGNTSAHEVAHQFLLSCCDMDSSPLSPSNFNPIPTEADANARGAWNAGGFSGKSDPSFWIGYWPSPKIALHWENTANPDGSPNALVGLETCLATGWYVTSASCWQP